LCRSPSVKRQWTPYLVPNWAFCLSKYMGDRSLVFIFGPFCDESKWKKYLAGDSELLSCKCCWKQVYLWKNTISAAVLSLFYVQCCLFENRSFFSHPLSVEWAENNHKRKTSWLFLHLYDVFTQCGSRQHSVSLIEKLFSIATNHLSWVFLAFSLVLTKSTKTLQEQKPFEHEQIGSWYWFIFILIKPRATRTQERREDRAGNDQELCSITSRNITLFKWSHQ